MKAVARNNYGPPSAIQVMETSTRAIKENEVLIRVYATTVNRTDSAMLTGKPFVFRFVTGLAKPKEAVLGTDFAGRVVELGASVTKFKVGDKVWGFDDEGLASQAEFLSISENASILTIPGDLEYKNIVACAEGAHYAVNFVNKIKIESDSKILINGATGAIGTALLQILKYKGAEITAVGNTRNIILLQSLGADHVIDYTKKDFVKTNEKYNYIFDAVGKSSYFKCKPLLHKGGVYISSELGKYGQNLYLPLITKIIGSSKVVFPFPSDPKSSLKFVASLIVKKHFKAVIDREYTLSEVNQAYEYVLTGEKTGNVVLNIQTEESI